MCYQTLQPIDKADLHQIHLHSGIRYGLKCP